MDAGTIAIVLFLLALVGQNVFRRGLLHRLLGKVRRRSAIGAAREGVVHIQGRVGVAAEMLRAPLSGAACVFYDLELTGLPSNDEGGWNDGEGTRRQYRGAWFTVEDDTGVAVVRFDGSGRGPSLALADDGPPRVRCSVPASVFWGPGAVDIDRPAAQAVLAEAGVATIQSKVKISEGLILPGDTVTIIGYGRWELDRAGQRQGYRDPPSQYVVTHDARQPLVIVRVQAGPGHQAVRCAI